MRDMKDDVLIGSIDEVAGFDGRCEPEGGTLAGMGIESQLVEGVCDVCGLDKRIKVGLKTRRRLNAEVAGGV